jgi:hypothetical protein
VHAIRTSATFTNPPRRRTSSIRANVASASARAPAKNCATAIAPAQLAKRREGWSPPASRYTTGVLAKYAKLVSSASKGAITG